MHLRPSLRDLARPEIEQTLRSLASLDGEVIDLEEVGSQLEDAANLCVEVRRHLAITDAGEDNVVLARVSDREMAAHLDAQIGCILELRADLFQIDDLAVEAGE